MKTKAIIIYIISANLLFLMCGCGVLQTAQMHKANKMVQTLKVDDSKEHVLSKFSRNDMAKNSKTLIIGGEPFEVFFIATSKDSYEVNYTPLVFFKNKLVCDKNHVQNYKLFSELAEFEDLKKRFPDNEVKLIMNKTIAIGMSEKALRYVCDGNLYVEHESYSSQGRSIMYEGWIKNVPGKFIFYVNNGKLSSFGKY
jgi:hypothetical protein